MSDTNLFPVRPEWAARAHVDAASYDRLCEEAVSSPDTFWGRIGQRLTWSKPFTQVRDVSFKAEDFRIKWYADGELNVTENCIDRHLARRADQTAIIWEGDDPRASQNITYRQLHDNVCRLANVLKARGVKNGDRITIYLPMIPEAAYAMLACARIGAIHSVVFAGFSPDALASRINDCGSKVVITADEGVRGGRGVPLKTNVDAALHHATGVETVLVVSRTGVQVPMTEGRDVVYETAVADA